MTLRIALQFILPLALSGAAAVTTGQNDAARSGSNIGEVILNTSNVNSRTFGKLFTRSVDGQIVAQPLYVPKVAIPGKGARNVIYVSTEHNSVYAFDADETAASAPFWHVNLGASVASATVGAFEEGSPEMGISSTPVIDVAAQTLYVVAATYESGAVRFNLHALDLATGASRKNSPALIQGQVAGTGADSHGGLVSFDSFSLTQRAALLLSNGRVYVGFGEHQSQAAVHGWVFAYDAGTLQPSAVFSTSPNSDGAGISEAGALTADGEGNIYVKTGRGLRDADTGGSDYGQSIVKLSSSLSVLGHLSLPSSANAASNRLNQGSGLALLTGTSFGAVASADGRMLLFDTAKLERSHSAGGLIEESQAAAGTSSALLVYNSTLYSWGGGSALRTFSFGGSRGETRSVADARAVASVATGDAVAMSISANGALPGSAILWASHSNGPFADAAGRPGVLRALDVGDTTKELWNSDQESTRDAVGAWAQWSVPTVAQGKVYVPTAASSLNVYGLLSDSSGTVTVSAIAPANQAGTSTSSALAQVSHAMAAAAVPTAAQVLPTGGASQSATIGAPFPNFLQATVTQSGGAPVNGATVTFMAPGSPTSVNASYFAMAENNPDFGSFLQEGNGGNSFVTTPGAGLGPNGLPVLNSTGLSILSDFNPSTHELQWWSTLSPYVSVLNNSYYPPQLALPFCDNHMYTTAGVNQTGDDSSAYMTAKLSGSFTLAATSALSFHFCTNDDGFIYLSGGVFGANGTLVVDNGGVQDVTCSAANVNTNLLSNVAPGNYTVSVFYDDRHQVGAELDLSITASNVAQGSFGGLTTVAVLTNASGVAAAPVFTANGQPGSYPVLATVAGVSTPATFNLTNNLSTPRGSLSGSGDSNAAGANLTTEGTADWVHWGDGSLARKAGVAPQLSTYTVVGSSNVLSYSDDPRPVSWTDGTPTASSSNNHNGVYIYGLGQGFSFTAPADTGTRTLIVHAGGWNSGGTLTAHLSDGSAADFVDVTPVLNGQYDRNYTLTYAAGSAGQTLIVTWVMNWCGNGNVTLNGASLVGSVPAAPTTIVASGGSPQSAMAGASFALPFQATVTNSSNLPVSGVTVTFSAPSSGPGGQFGSGATATALTNGSGIATSPAFTANSQTGGYAVTASVTGVATPASFSLTNTAGLPASIKATAGTPQIAPVNAAFAAALQATVTDGNNNPVNGATVTFTAPGTGASGKFGASATASVLTNASGVALSPAFTANSQAGGYTVTASVAGAATAASFSLTNSASSGVGALSGVFDTSSSAVNLTAEGATDWVHWGDGVLNRKAGVAAQLSDYSVVGTGPVLIYNNDSRQVNWTDGSPTANGSADSVDGIYIRAAQNGLSFTAPADTSVRTLKIHAGGYFSGATLTAHLSDGSALDFVDSYTSINGVYDRNYTLTYSAGAAGQTLTIKWVMNAGSGNITLSAAALAGASQSLTPPPPPAGPAAIVASGGTMQSATVNTAFAAPLQATVTDAGNNPLSGVQVTFAAPASGASGLFGAATTAVVSTNASGIAAAPAFTANGQSGSFTVTATVTGLTPASFSLTNNAVVPAVQGSLTGVSDNLSIAANLTVEGATDWIHWGDGVVERKAGVTPQLSNYAVVGSGPALLYNDDSRTLNWTDGTPLTNGSADGRDGVYIRGAQNGFSFTAPAGTGTRTLTIHAGGYFSGGTLTAHLSDNSAVDFVAASPAINGVYDRNYTLTYNSATPSATLTVTLVMNSGTGNITLSAAAVH